MQAPVNAYMPAVVMGVVLLNHLRKGVLVAYIGIALLIAWVVLVSQ